MSRQFIVGFSMVSGRSGEIFSSAPVIPIRIAAETAVAALETFAMRSEGTILSTSRGSEGIVDAKVGVDGRVFRVRVSDWAQ
jgi:hypothetical protein